MAKLQSSPDVALALEHWELVNSIKGQWAALNIQFEPTRRIEMEIGYYNAFEYRERAIATRIYYEENGRATFRVQGHPA